MSSCSSKSKEENIPVISCATSLDKVPSDTSVRGLGEVQGSVPGQDMSPLSRRESVLGQGLSPLSRRGSVLGQEMSPLSRRGSVLGQEMSPLSRRGSLLRQGSLHASEDGREPAVLSRQGSISVSRRSSHSPLGASAFGPTSSTISALRAAVDEGNGSPYPHSYPYPYPHPHSYPCPHPHPYPCPHPHPYPCPRPHSYPCPHPHPYPCPHPHSYPRFYMIFYTVIMILELIKITVYNIQSLSAAIQRSEANRLHIAMKSVKAENRDKWTQVKKAFAISKEVNLKAMELLRQEATEKDVALKGVTSQLDEYKDAATSALMIIRMAQRVSAAPGDSNPSDSIDDLATTLTTAAMALLEQLGDLQMRYSMEFEEAWRLRENSKSNSNSNSGLESAVLDTDPGKYLPSPSPSTSPCPLLYTLYFTFYRTTLMVNLP